MEKIIKVTKSVLGDSKGKFIIKDIDILPPKANELLIKVEAAGVNRADIEQAKGAYPPPVGASPVLGLELAGTVHSIGKNVKNFKPGDPVMTLVAGGAYSEYAIAPEETTLHIPTKMSFIEAAAIPEAYFTVWYNVFDKGHFKPNEIFLIHGGASGVGSAAIQIVKAMGGLVIATVSNDIKKTACLNLGADYVINYKTESFYNVTLQMTNNAGVDVILDWIGAIYLEDHLKLLKKNGRLLCIDSSKVEGTIDFDLLLGKCLTISGSLLRPLPLTEKEKIKNSFFKYLYPKLENQEIKPLIHCALPLSQVEKAHHIIQSSSHIGKVVLTLPY